MKFSVRTEYACIAILGLAAAHEKGAPVSVRELADAHGIQPAFLLQVLLQFKNAGLVTSYRGPTGGYQLARPPEEITLADVVTVIEGEEPEQPSSVGIDSRATRVLKDVWREAKQAERAIFDSVTIAELIQRSRQHAGTMYYI